MSEPLNILHLDIIKNSLKYEILPYFSDPSQILIKQQEYLKENIIEDRLKSIIVKEELYSDGNEESVYYGSFQADDNLLEFISSVITRATQRSASDIHFDPSEENVKVRFRIDGDIMNIFEIPKEIYPNIVSRFKLLSSLNISEKRLPQDGGFDIELQNNRFDIRSSFVPTLFGEKIVLRIVNKHLNTTEIDQLGMEANEISLVKRIIERKQGLILVTGPTGSGKTTTLYSILKELNSDNINIITIEDPVEQKIEGLNQIQVNTEIGLDFKTILRHVLRQDPDVIMVGEIRDIETARMAISSAITGHMVLSTLHTEDSASALVRLMDMGIEKHLVLTAVRAVISQRLYRVNCPKCLKEEKVRHDYIQYFNEIGIDKIFSSSGCEDCRYTSCVGREALFEVLEFNDKVNEIFRDNLSIVEIRKTLNLLKHETLNSKMIEKIKSGKADFNEYIKLFGI